MEPKTLHMSDGPAASDHDHRRDDARRGAAMDDVIVVEGLRKRYGATTAVDGVSLTVAAGEIFGILGPNGAGKTTTVECLEGLVRPDEGSVQVLGLDPARRGRELRQRVGIQLQHAVLPRRIRVREALDLYASFYQDAADPEPLIEAWGLAGKRDAMFETLSGGQRQRLFVALALLNEPELVFLDELTTGLDPQARRATWDLVRQIRDRGVTVVLVTHFLEEAERLCDRIAVFDAGRIVVVDSPQALKARFGGTEVPEADVDRDGSLESAYLTLTGRRGWE
jgi:ABC-2 type transport system ATP-binding protein